MSGEARVPTITYVPCEPFDLGRGRRLFGAHKLLFDDGFVFLAPDVRLPGQLGPIDPREHPEYREGLIEQARRARAFHTERNNPC